MMNATLRNLILATVAVVAPGCLHGSTLGTTGVLECEARFGAEQCIRRGDLDPDGDLRLDRQLHIKPADRCDLVVELLTSYDDESTMTSRVRDERSCGVSDKRVSTFYDLEGAIIRHRVERDVDHDGEMDVDRWTEVPMPDAVRAMVRARGRADTARIKSDLVAQTRDRARTHRAVVATSAR